MTESFWFLPDDGHESDAERPELSGVPFDAREGFAPFQEPMRGDRSRPQRAPSTDQKRMRRQIHRSGQQHTAIGPAFDEVNWDELHPQLKDMADNGELHRGIGINLPDELHRYIHDSSQPQHERAHALLNHIAGMNGREPGDHRLGLGMHWSLSNGIAEGFAADQADHYADANKDKVTGDGEDTAHDFSWGKVPGDVDISEVKHHLHEHHGVHPFHQPMSDAGIRDLHTMLHRGAPPMPGQQALFPEPPKVPKANQHVDLDEFREPDEPRAKPGTEIVLHTPIPAREDIEEHPQGNPNAGGDVYHPLNHGEAEVPIRSGASLPITGVSWREHPHWADTIGEKDPEYVHHRFDDQGMPFHEAHKTATVLNTQIERLNKGDQIRTPTGQTSVVQGLRPHETDSTLMYLDTDQGTSTVKRGTDFQVVPQNSQQQELPDTGNPMGSGNTGQLPGSGRTPGGAGVMPQTAPGTCPNCGNSGTLHLQGGNYICSVCGFTVPAGGTPGGLTFTNQPSGAMPPRRKPGEIPRAHVWASKYTTTMQESQIARRARQVSGGEQ